MPRKILCLALCLFFTIPVMSCSNNEPAVSGYHWGIDPDKLPMRLTDRTFPKYSLGSLEQIYGLAGQDMNGKNLSRLSLQFISEIAFDYGTVWPEVKKLPDGFSPSQWIETGKDPGLQLAELHAQGYTGEGISVAIIDKPISPEHDEIKNQIEYIDLSGDSPAHFHGLACASVLAGQTCGVAPGTKLYYFAVPDDGNNFKNYSEAILDIIELNNDLPEKDKIRIISISDGIQEGHVYWQQWCDAKKQAEANGIIVLYSINVAENFISGGCLPYLDRDDPANYTLPPWLDLNGAHIPLIILPADYRTTASYTDERQYIYWGQGGFSWAIPYLAGLMAIGLQINPDFTYDDVIDMLVRTKATTSDGNYIVNPTGFIKEAENSKK